MRSVALKEANQQFSRIVREVEAGEAFEITRHGKVVARILPVGEHSDPDETWRAARERTLTRMKQGYAGGEPWCGRDELYDDV